MKNQDNSSVAISSDLTYALTDKDGKLISDGSAKAKLNNRFLSISPDDGELLTVPYTDIITIAEDDYRINLFLSSGFKITLSQLGYNYENFLLILIKMWNELLMKYLLMNEGLRASQIDSSFIYYTQDEEVLRGLSELRLYDSALIILPQKSKPIRVPYCYISNFQEKDYSVYVESELGERFVFSQMGEKRDFFKRSLSEAIDELTERTQLLIKELMPQLDTVKMRRLTHLLREGKAAEKTEIDKVADEFWIQLETKAKTMGLENSYDFLKEIGQSERICLGMKRGLSLKTTEDYIWFLVPIYGIGISETGNAVALEATTGDDEGKATYFFRIMSRKDYSITKDLPKLNQEFDRFLGTVNQCMIEINFRREPIYLTEDQLSSSKYLHYKFAVQEMPSLRMLRNLFIGRIMHYSPEQWKNDVLALLKFNMDQKDDDSKWVKGSK
jgi:hypothetical protein